MPWVESGRRVPTEGYDEIDARCFWPKVEFRIRARLAKGSVS
jgi:hypothetical protein